MERLSLAGVMLLDVNDLVIEIRLAGEIEVLRAYVVMFFCSVVWQFVIGLSLMIQVTIVSRVSSLLSM